MLSNLKETVSNGLALALSKRDQQNAEKEARKRVEFLKLIERQTTADGHDPEKLLAILDKMGVTAEEFQTAFEAQCDRLEWAELASHLDEHKNGLADVRAKLAAAKSARDEKLAKAQQAIENEYIAVTQKLKPIETELKTKTDIAQEALWNLQRTAPLPVTERLDSAKQKLRDAERELEEAKKPKYRAEVDVGKLMSERRKLSDLLRSQDCQGMHRANAERRLAQIGEELAPAIVDLAPFEAAVEAAEQELATVQTEFDIAATNTHLV